MPPRDREVQPFSLRLWTRKMRKNPKIRSLNEQSSPFRKMVQQEAVVVRNAVKCYDAEKLVIDGLDMTVSRGSIYGLLGASGCGKTTLLSCIVGVRRLDKGEVWVLGGNPGSMGSGIPGPRVGYMPQEISLVGEFSVSGALYYFGRINGLEDDEIDTRQTFLSELLQLPPANRLVKNMSGGQQRRVSFAAALIHRPELLILDEPTVGLDPVLRDNIWNYLIKITQEEGITVLITTHYIEETKEADKIGLMRCGRLLAESSPQQLLERFQCSLLEEAFLKLCQPQNSIVPEAHGSKDTASNVLHQDCDEHKQTKTKNSEYKVDSRCKVSSLKRFKALMVKNSIQFLRYYTGLTFAIIFPILQAGSFFIGIGNDPKGLTIGVINNEAGNCDYGSNLGNIWYDEENYICHFSNLSCKFLHHFDNSIAIKKYYDDLTEANQAVHHGKIYGIIYFNQNFSEALQSRIENMFYIDNADLLASEIQVSLDMSEMDNGLFIQKKLFDRFIEIFKDVMRDCRLSSKLAEIPVRFEDPIYGLWDLTYADYVAPSYMLMLVFFLGNAISTSLIITDRAEGVWNRSLVQGVRTSEILLAHTLTQTFLVIIHTTMTMFLFFIVWGLECKGSIFAVILIVFLTGSCGLMYGFFLSVVCTNHTMANYASIGSFFPLIVLCGVIWPVEGMPKMLRWFSYSLPITYPGISLRGAIYKGSSIYDLEVYSGMLVNIAWIVFLFIIILIGLRLKSS